MSSLDLRYLLLLITNIIKSHIVTPCEWDAFDVATNFTWIKFWLLTLLFFIFAFVSIGIPLHTSTDTNMGYIRVQIKKFSASLTLSYLASIFIPQLLFWYLYPLILLLFSCSASISNLYWTSMFRLQAILATLPDFNLLLIATDNIHEEENLEEGGEQV